MSEELRRYVEDALYKWIAKQIEQGNFRANLRIEIDTPIEIKGLKGRVVGEILLSEDKTTYEVKMPAPQTSEPIKPIEGKKASTDGEEMSLQEVEKLLKSLGI
ncbi:MAG: hypothetical protein QXO54_05730 [Candidatus Methanomethylicaceae archaeon]|nr:hypothetical protein [Candidatus Verstraetearchaeota archaeon]